MAEKREALKSNYGSYISGLEFALSLWKENLKPLNTQFNEWLTLGQSYTNAEREFHQRKYIGLVRDFSDNFIKETINPSRRNTEKAFSSFDSYFNN